MAIETAGRIVFTALMVVVLIWDVRFLRIPDRLNLLIVAAFVPIAALLSLPWEVLLTHIGMGVFVFACFLAVALLGPMGGGDVKLGGAVGLWIGTAQGVLSWLLMAGLLYILFLVVALYARKYGLRYLFKNIQVPSWLHDLLSRDVSIRRAVIPFGLPLAAGAIIWAWN